MNNLGELQNIINYEFNNINLLEQALTHSSYANEKGVDSYERLEFLGDAIIELIVSEYIYKFKELDSGNLTKLRSALVSTTYFNNISLKLKLDKYVRLSKSVVSLSKKNTADLFESLIGAMYLDGGINAVKDLILKYVIKDEKNIQDCIKNSIDYKSQLQELMQKNVKSFEYKLSNSYGASHDMTFEVDLYIEGLKVSSASGKSIHLAEQECAKKYLNQ